MSRVIELGHTYVPDRLVPLGPGLRSNGYEYLDTKHAERLREVASSLGRPAVWVALIDDVSYREQIRTTEDPWRARTFLEVSKQSVQAGTQADIICYESSFEGVARRLVDGIRGGSLPQGVRLSKDESRLIVGRGSDRLRVPLMGFKGVKDPTYPSCPVLDLAWLNYKLSLAEESVTILPHGYEAQQAQVTELARVTGAEIDRASTVYVDEVL